MNRRTHATSLHQALYGLKKTILSRVKHMTVPRLLQSNSKQYPDEVAIYAFPQQRYTDTPVGMTWRCLDQQARQLAAYFLQLKIQQQSIMIIARNRPEHFIADLAALYAGNIPCSVYTSQTAEQIAHLLQISHAPLMIVDDTSMYQTARAAIKLHGKPVQLICMEKPQRLYRGSLAWHDAMQAGQDYLPHVDQTINRLIQNAQPKDPVCTIFTSGTTGKPKGVILSHENVLFAAASIEAVGTVHIPRARLLSYLPLAHVFERVVGYYGGLLSRHRLYCVWSIQDLSQAMLAVRPDIFVAVPRVYEKIEAGIDAKLADSWLYGLFKRALDNGSQRNRYLQQHQQPPLFTRLAHQCYTWFFLHTIRKAVGLDRCRLCLSGSAPLDPSIIDFFSTLNLDIVEGYGLTENSAPACVSWNQDLCNNMRQLFQSAKITAPEPFYRHFGRVGYPMPGTQVKIDAAGMIQVKGPHVFSGYLHDAKNTHAALQSGWLRTGDLGMIHPSGEIEISGRKKDLIILSNGKNVAPRHIESMLVRHPLIAHAALAGDGKAYVIAIICLQNDGSELRYAKAHGLAHHDRQAIAKDKQTHAILMQHIEKVNQHFCRPEQIKYYHLTTDIWSSSTGELTPTLKLKRPCILAQYHLAIEKIYQEHDPSHHHHDDHDQ